MTTPAQKRTLYVGGLDEQVTEAILKAAFIPFGDIIDVIIPLEHNSTNHRGFGFVEYELPEDAADALDNLNESELFGKVLHCNLAKPVSLAGKTKPVWAEPDFYEKSGQATTDGTEGEEKDNKEPTEDEKRDKEKEKIEQFIAEKVSETKS